jgi:CelD/BcsL family acetyltransferase involved in cellulose biosynthesis
MPRIRPKERDAVAELLSTPADSVTALATDVLLLVDRMREERPDWYVLVHDPGVGVFLHGSFITKNAAQRAIDKGEVFAASPGATAMVMQLMKHSEGESDA